MAVIGIDASRAVTAQRTGTEAYAYFLIQALIPLAAERGHQLRLYFNQPPDGLFPASDHVEIVNIPFARLWTHLRLAWELHRRGPQHPAVDAGMAEQRAIEIAVGRVRRISALALGAFQHGRPWSVDRAPLSWPAPAKR